MLKQKFDRIWESPIKASAFMAILWAAVTNILFILSDKVLVSIFALMMFFGFIYPAASLVMFFKLGKRHGILWYFYVSVIVVTVAEYLLVPHFTSISPNIIVMTILCLIFGCGFGSCFADNDMIKAEKEQRRLRKLNEDKAYKKILDNTEPNKKGKK